MFLLCSIVLSYLHQQVSPVNPCLSTILLEPSGVSWGDLCSCWIAVRQLDLYTTFIISNWHCYCPQHSHNLVMGICHIVHPSNAITEGGGKLIASFILNP